jgi:parallel beta-helix repeat protein
MLEGKRGMTLGVRRWLLGVGCVMGLTASVFGQGSLTPPGAPGATMKTLEEIDAAIAGVSNAVGAVEARIDLATVAGDGTYHHVINQSGSYYLSGNLGVTKTSGISITAANVTLDLNGFTVSRSAGSGGTGIYILGDRATVRNGSVFGFSSGVYASSEMDGLRLFNIKASQCSLYGIYTEGTGARLVDCIATQNTEGGMYVGDGSILSGCIASHNQGNYAIYEGNGSILSGCSAFSNQGSYAMRTGNGSVVTQSTAYNNTVRYGILANKGSSVIGCTVYGNEGVTSTSYGIYADESSVVDCVSAYNSNTNSPSASDQGVGIFAHSASIKNCIARYNSGDGIRIVSKTFVEGNTSYSNGNGGDGAGIHVTGAVNRIENNHVSNNDRGIDVDQSGNVIVRNTARVNTTNWTVVTGNYCLVVQAVAGGSFSGNSGGTALGSTDPNTNFTYN